MTRVTHRMRRLLAMLAAVITLTAALAPVSTANATPVPTWSGWSVEVDFEAGAPHVVYTVYVGTSTPDIMVLDSISDDISDTCTTIGSVTYQNGAAHFDGSSYLSCTLPSWRTTVATMAPGLPHANNNNLTCDAGLGPLWVAAEANLTPVSNENPILNASGVGIAFSLPSNGIGAKSRLMLSNGGRESPGWMLDPAKGNKMLMGLNGEATIVVADYHDWLTFLDSGWEGPFGMEAVGTTMAHLAQPSGAISGSPSINYQLKTTASTIYIGYNPATKAKLRGDLFHAQIDPGCKTI